MCRFESCGPDVTTMLSDFFPPEVVKQVEEFLAAPETGVRLQRPFDVPVYGAHVDGFPVDTAMVVKLRPAWPELSDEAFHGSGMKPRK